MAGSLGIEGVLIVITERKLPVNQTLFWALAATVLSEDEFSILKLRLQLGLPPRKVEALLGCPKAQASALKVRGLKNRVYRLMTKVKPLIQPESRGYYHMQRVVEFCVSWHGLTQWWPTLDLTHEVLILKLDPSPRSEGCYWQYDLHELHQHRAEAAELARMMYKEWRAKSANARITT